MNAAAILFAAAAIAGSCRDAEAALASAAATLGAPESALEAAWLAATRVEGTWRRASGERASRLLSAACGLA
jgi:hypothetical protein